MIGTDSTLYDTIEHVSFFQEKSFDIILAFLFAIIAAFILEMLFMPFRRLWYFLRGSRKYFDVIWLNSRKLRPEMLLGIRAYENYGFNEYYYQREHDQHVENLLRQGKNVLVTGNPLGGLIEDCPQDYFTTVESLNETIEYCSSNNKTSQNE